MRQLAVASPDGALTLQSDTLGLELRVQGGEMRFRDPATGQVLRSHREEAAARRDAESRADAAAARVEAHAAALRTADARIAELEALLRGTAERTENPPPGTHNNTHSRLAPGVPDSRDVAVAHDSDGAKREGSAVLSAAPNELPSP